MYVFSTDGVTVDRLRTGLPKPMQRRINTDNAWVVVDDSNREDCGYYLVTEIAQPANSPTESFFVSVVNTAPGAFTTQWDHDQAKHDARIANETATAQYATLAGEISWLRGRADVANGTTVTSGNTIAVLQTVMDDLARFFDRFADKLEADGTRGQ